MAADTGKNNVFSASARGASYLILLQLFTRVLTFTFNQLVLRHTSPQVFGFATIQLELLSSTILFLSREGFRIALQRQQQQQQTQDLQTTVNLAYIPLVTGFFGAVGGCWVFWKRLGPDVRGLGGEGWTIVLVGWAVVVELSCEVCFVVGLKMLMFRMRTVAEGTAVIARCLTTYGMTIWLLERGLLEQYGTVSFGVGQLAYATTLAGVYFVMMSKRVGLRNLVPRKVLRGKVDGHGGEYWLHGPTLRLAFSVTGQSLFKHVLTEGDKFVLASLTTPYTQGLYAVVSNYGSLIARILFQPVEEILRTILSRLLSTSSSSPTKQSLEQSSTLITTLLRLHVLLAIAILALVLPVLPTLLLPILTAIIGKDRFPPSSLLPILQAYLYYIPIMAVNGITESFITSVATTKDLARQSRAMILFSILFLGISYILLTLLHFGGEGLVWANCVNLGVRIAWSCAFITRWYGERNASVGWRRAIPEMGTWVVGLGVGFGLPMVCVRRSDGFIDALSVAGVGGLSLACCMLLSNFLVF